MVDPSRYSTRHVQHMEMALLEATKALNIGEVPVGCVIVQPSTTANFSDRIIGRGANRTNLTCNATRHAEFEALDEILQSDSNIDFSQCELYVTVEPCIMCAAALARVGIGSVFFGCSNEKFGGTGSILSLHKQDAPLPIFATTYTCYPGLLKDEAIQLLRNFYEMGNPHAPKPQRPVVEKEKHMTGTSV
jgi:tRNA-specific adenosine deaminase 2